MNTVQESAHEAGRDKGLLSARTLALALVSATFAVNWAWQTSILYAPIVGSDFGNMRWYTFSLLNCLTYGLCIPLAPLLQRHLTSRPAYSVGTGCLVAATLLEFLVESQTHSVGAFVAGRVFVALGCTLLALQRFHLLCRFSLGSERGAILLIGTTLSLLLFTLYTNLDRTVLAFVLALTPLTIPPCLKKASRILDELGPGGGATMSDETGAAPRPHIPWRILLAFPLVTFALNLIRSEIDYTSASSGPETSATMALVTLVVAGVCAVTILIRRRFSTSASTYAAVLLVTLATLCVCLPEQLPELAPVFSSAAFYIVVAYFWETASAYGNEAPAHSVWVTSAFHFPYHIGYFFGTVAFQFIGSSSMANESMLVLFASYSALVGAFTLKGRSKADVPAIARRYDTGGQEARGALRRALFDSCLQFAKENDLTQREYDVLCSFATGKGVKAVADELAVSENTVKSHLSHIYAKTGSHSREDLMLRLFADGDPDSGQNAMPGGEPDSNTGAYTEPAAETELKSSEI